MLIALLCYRYTGYAHSLIGSIIANEGFIKQFATVTDPATGEPALDSQHISLWQASSFVSQIFIQLFSHLTADRYGRKFNMWAFTALLTTVSLVPPVPKPNARLYLERCGNYKTNNVPLVSPSSSPSLQSLGKSFSFLGS